jgi:soluble lytic murein transglycosylase-like protein
MLVFRESRPGRPDGATQRGSLGRIAVSLLMVSGLAGADPASAALVQEPDTGRVGSPEAALAAEANGTSYVGHVLGTPAPSPAAESLVLDPPSEEPRAAAYARRYGISQDLALDIVEHALAEGIDPELAFRLIRVESVFKTSARGPQGALGLMQIMPGTARALDRTLDTTSEILDPHLNLRTGLRYLRQLIERYDDVRLGVLAYNRGETSVDRARRRGVDPENGYSHKVLGTRGSTPYTGTGLVPRRARDASAD